MPTLGNYYIDAPTFSDATAVYTDVALTTKAADGYYQSGGVYRRQLLGVLTAGVTLCPTCNKGICGVNPISSWLTSQYGVYDFDIELGTGTGAWRIVLSPGNIPNGIFVTYDGDSYPNTTSGTKIYSSVFGALDGPYVGDNTAAAGYGFPSATGIYELPVLAWDGNPNGSTFSLTGTTETIGPITAVDFSGTAGGPGECNIFVRKQNAEPQTATIRVIGPVGGAADNFRLTNNCATPLGGFLCSATPRANAVDACADAVINTYYNGDVNGSPGNPAIRDVIFVNSTAGLTLGGTLGAGFYGYRNGTTPGATDGYFEIDAEGVIITIGTCPP